MAKPLGWAGTVLNVDLSTGRIDKEELPLDFARKYLGASGFNAAKLFDEVKPETDAFSPENVLMLGVGALTGTLAPGSSRLTFTAKSPLTDIYGDSSMGGHLAAELKFAGYDQVVVRGKADRPVYLLIDGDKVELRDGGHLWGKSTWETSKLVCEEVGDPHLLVASIGTAGENLVRFATVMVPTKRAAGRTGMGAVLGAKNLKAIAVRGANPVSVARPTELLEAVREMRETVADSYHFYHALHNYGTPGFLDIAFPKGGVIVKYFNKATFDNWEEISGKSFRQKHYKSMRGCTGCQVACGPFSYVSSGEYAGVYGEGPEYALVGRYLLMNMADANSLQKVNEDCNKLGIDYLSACAVMAWAMECYDRGLLTDGDFDGRPLRYGDEKSVVEILPKIAAREGFGAILAEGEKRAPDLLGRGSEKLIVQSKGMSPVSHDPRSNKGFGLGYITGTRGADHLKGCVFDMFYLLRDTELGKSLGRETFDVLGTDGIGRTLKWSEDMTQVVDALGMCIRSGGSIQLLVKALSATTGLDFTMEELLAVGERVFNVQKAFNARQGLDRKDDDFSVRGRFTNEPVTDGPLKGAVFERDAMLDEYYQTRQWDVATGLQTKRKLSSLGLEHLIPELEAVNALRP